MKLESDLPPGAVVWSLDRLQLQGAKVQETSDGKTSAVPAGGLVFLRRLHLNVTWSSDVPCHIYIRVPPPPPALRPTWPLTVEEAKRLHKASSKAMEYHPWLGNAHVLVMRGNPCCQHAKETDIEFSMQLLPPTVQHL